MNQQPIILLGAARSGTKFLRDCLAASSGVAAVPYDINYVWRYRQSHVSHDVLDPSRQTPKIRSFLHNTITRLADAKLGDIVIEKTVSNTLRVPYVASVYPDARYIHLIRDGREVAESAMRQWTEPPKMGALWTKFRSLPLSNVGYLFWYAKNIVSGMFSTGRRAGRVWGPRYPGIDEDVAQRPLAEICALQWRNSVLKTKKDLEAIDPSRVFIVRYEDLVSDSATIRNLAEKLNLPEPVAILDHFEKTVHVADGLPAWSRLSAEDQAAFDRVLRQPLKQLGYST